MSKLLDKLNRVSRGPAQPLGFRTAASRPKSPSMALIAVLSPGDTHAATAARKSADAVLLKGAECQIVASLGEVPWGATLDEATDPDYIGALKGMGCDFLVFDAAKSPPALLREEAMGKIVEITTSLADGLIRAIEQLPIDAVLIGGDSKLSVQRLMVCRHLANLVRKPLVVLAPLSMSKEDLEELREVGMAGVVVRVEGLAEEELSRLRQTIDALPPSSRRRRGRVEALLPYPREEGMTRVEEEVEEEEEEE